MVIIISIVIGILVVGMVYEVFRLILNIKLIKEIRNEKEAQNDQFRMNQVHPY